MENDIPVNRARHVTGSGESEQPVNSVPDHTAGIIRTLQRTMEIGIACLEAAYRPNPAFPCRSSAGVPSGIRKVLPGCRCLSEMAVRRPFGFHTGVMRAPNLLLQRRKRDRHPREGVVAVGMYAADAGKGQVACRCECFAFRQFPEQIVSYNDRLFRIDVEIDCRIGMRKLDGRDMNGVADYHERAVSGCDFEEGVPRGMSGHNDCLDPGKHRSAVIKCPPVIERHVRRSGFTGDFENPLPGGGRFFRFRGGEPEVVFRF